MAAGGLSLQTNRRGCCQSRPSACRPSREEGGRRSHGGDSVGVKVSSVTRALSLFFFLFDSLLASPCFSFSALHIFTLGSFAPPLVGLRSAAEQLQRSRWRLSAFLKITPRVTHFFLGQENNKPTSHQYLPSGLTTLSFNRSLSSGS